MKYQLRVFRVAAAALCLTCGLARAAELKVAMIQLPFWTMPGEGGPGQAQAQYQGIVVELLTEFEKRTGHHLVRVMTPYLRVEGDLESGACDFSVMAWGEARAAYANKGTVLFPLEFGVRARKGVPLSGYESLRKLRISVTRGLKVEPRFDTDAGLNKVGALDYATGVKRAAVKDVDGVAGSLSTIDQTIRALGLQDQFGETLVLRTTPAAVAFSKRSPKVDLEKSVNAVFQSMVDDGTAKKIHDKWLKNKAPYPDCSKPYAPSSFARRFCAI